MPAKSLVELCTRVCIRHIHEVTSLGDLLLDNNDYVRHILLRVDNAAQLQEIEENSPQLQGELEEFWRRLIQRDFPTLQKRKNYIPQRADQWHKVYAKLLKEQKAERAEARQALQANFADIKKEKDKHVSRILDKRESRLLLKQGSGRGLGIRRAGGRDLPSTLNFGAGSRMKMTTGRSVMKRVRREVREIANARSTLSTPSGIRSIPKSGIKMAPQAMINDREIAAQPAISTSSAIRRQTQAKIPKPIPASSGNYISDSDSEDGDDCVEEEDPLFDEEKPRSRLAKSQPSTKDAATFTTSQPLTSPTLKKTVPLASKRGGGLLSNAYQPPEMKDMVKPASASNSMSSAQRPKSAGHQASPSTTASSPHVSPPLKAADRSSSPPKLVAGLGQDSMLPRKRRAVDIFMKPNKRR
jgi:elongin-A